MYCSFASVGIVSTRYTADTRGGIECSGVRGTGWVFNYVDNEILLGSLSGDMITKESSKYRDSHEVRVCACACRT